MIAIIDYGMGNLRSVAKALEAAGAKNVKVTSSAGLILRADKLVLPGVGAMQEAMRELRKLRLLEVIKKNIFRKPFLGICLGLQLLFSESQEGGKVRGLGIFKGGVKRFSRKLKVPQMGWNQIRIKNQESRIKNFKNIPDNSYFYFCHSYYVIPEDKSIIIATTDYGREFVSAIAKDNLFACQFHPEKSQRLGLRLLENFVKI
ncbi:MAG: imidazole glycerol phosphate synthase, glutamine amidotransferase subunit [Omnitrophica WOR_2 bacterium RIFCSPLOWO2_12_FULL_46_30]|nr:MAG: imidazole glycerol phosphate synthase, glutamine amidotransferase subunit [Omnitrophica WOR_2 bacterium RIFCSPHIGHO2_02_FULL_46_37]OGX41995.1 MAG: imidazole glycerol phosphate synthase, glutamine amidotransferase subunit [Omnitrophica WOR_2 bacterium RIFCSPLOWO2_02_FULL_45_28]OGX52441.1 MAG: imidazole glycerol phosphate synthase, glutamine amidotransferase subunit [Omnitrophica WOR_2 bacterium RIFCSPLOWO2_12_FULL_46_30]